MDLLRLLVSAWGYGAILTIGFVRHKYLGMDGNGWAVINYLR